MSYKVTIRVGPRVTRERVPTLADAIDLLEMRLTALGPEVRRDTSRALFREVAPVGQVSARGELAGPGRLNPTVFGGADVRGDCSIEAYRGRVNREVIELRARETAFEALRRVLEAT